MAETQVGQPTLMLSSDLKNTQGLVVVVVKGNMDPAQVTQGLDAVIPSLNFSDLDLKSFLHMLSNTSGLSFSIAPEVKGKVNLSLKNTTVRQALEFALQTNNWPIP
jgi:type II secretory pathway component GspD/PulD (secretin)